MGEYDDFDLDRSVTQAWERFEERLAEVISVMDDTAPLTIGCVGVQPDDEVPYIRFSTTDNRNLFVEAASNASLGESYQLRVDQLDALSSLGWQDPVSHGDHPTANFWILRDQEHFAELAHITVTTLQQVYGVQHPVFLSPDQLAEILTPHGVPVAEAPLHGFDADDVVAVMPRDQAHLNELVDQELTDMFGHVPMRDEEGDVAIRVGSTMVFLRPSLELGEILLFAIVVHDVDGRSRAVEVLNDLNTDTRRVCFQLVRDRVFLTMSLFAHPFVPAHLHQAVRLMSEVADGTDDVLASKLGGRTTFNEH